MFGIGRDDKARDPVCGMKVDKNRTQFSYEKGGQKFYFCSQNCKNTFIEDSKKETQEGNKCCN